jgi:hypothetical protein
VTNRERAIRHAQQDTQKCLNCGKARWRHALNIRCTDSIRCPKGFKAV